MRRVICLLAGVFFLWAPMIFAQGPAQPDRSVLVPGNPPLQQNAVHDLAAFLEWVLEARMTEGQREAFQKELIRTWKADHEPYILWLKLKISADSSSAEKRAQMRAQLRPLILQSFRAGTEMAQLIQSLAASGARTTGIGGATGQSAAAGTFSGSFSASAQGGVIHLALEQRDARRVTGRLQGLGGAVFELQGELQPDGKVLGVAKGPGGGLFFLGQAQGSHIQMVFAEPDANMKPNMATAKNVIFTRQGASPAQPGMPAQGAAPGQPGSVAPGGQEHLLQGMLCSYSGASSPGGSYSSSTRARFDGRGNFSYGGESYSSGYAGQLYSGGGGAGNVGRYRVQGNQIQLTFADGTTAVAAVHFRQPNGMITEVQFEGKLYGQGLCD